MKKFVIILISFLVIFVGIINFQKTTYSRKPEPAKRSVMRTANDLMDNPIENILLTGYKLNVVNGENYILSAKTIFNLNLAEISITCNERNDCSGKVLKRWF